MPRKTVAPFYQEGFPSAEGMLYYEGAAQHYTAQLKEQLKKQEKSISCIKTSAQQINNKSPTYELDIFALVASYR